MSDVIFFLNSQEREEKLHTVHWWCFAFSHMPWYVMPFVNVCDHLTVCRGVHLNTFAVIAYHWNGILFGVYAPTYPLLALMVSGVANWKSDYLLLKVLHSIIILVLHLIYWLKELKMSDLRKVKRRIILDRSFPVLCRPRDQAEQTISNGHSVTLH